MKNAVIRDLETKADMLELLNILRSDVKKTRKWGEWVISKADELKQDKDVVKLIKRYSNVLEFKLKSGKEYESLATAIVNIFEVIDDQLDRFETIIITSFPKYMTDKTATAKGIGIKQFFDNMISVYFFSSEILTLLSCNGDDSIELREIEKNLVNYAPLYEKFVSVKVTGQLLTDIENLSNKVVVDKHGNFIKGLLSIGDSKILIGANGFVGNPIYHLGKLWVDHKFNRLEIIEERRKIVEAHIYDLEVGTTDSKEAVEYHKERLARLKYEVSEIKKER